ncbi:DUF6262 family protein [Clostridium estertheticum]|uniref:DUF6262 family protein n=1 Tax=Clostridium estertheticum TaxID=238834 RepID=A0AA47ENY4_9CLOT|nr:DUF6262 family protein [Clostridium estertheticum]MBU3154473.1 hypothetical protein [Clostridium estertheticum]WAG62088.1 DUF6262 family protein [Clostridium estertheticum]
MRKLPQNLIEKQEKIRTETLLIIQGSIDELNAEGYLITIKDLIERTKFSRSLFSKPHVQEILKKNKIGKYKNTKTINEKVDEDIREKSFRLEKELINAKVKIEKMKNDNEVKIASISNLKVKFHDKTEECEILRGELHILMQKAKILGFDLKLADSKG